MSLNELQVLEKLSLRFPPLSPGAPWLAKLSLRLSLHFICSRLYHVVNAHMLRRIEVYWCDGIAFDISPMSRRTLDKSLLFLASTSI
jgi:hypothetical protein